MSTREISGLRKGAVWEDCPLPLHPNRPTNASNTATFPPVVRGTLSDDELRAILYT
jgi:hypothetical protein